MYKETGFISISPRDKPPLKVRWEARGTKATRKITRDALPDDGLRRSNAQPAQRHHPAL